MPAPAILDDCFTAGSVSHKGRQSPSGSRRPEAVAPLGVVESRNPPFAIGIRMLCKIALIVGMALVAVPQMSLARGTALEDGQSKPWETEAAARGRLPQTKTCRKPFPYSPATFIARIVRLADGNDPETLPQRFQSVFHAKLLQLTRSEDGRT